VVRAIPATKEELQQQEQQQQQLQELQRQLRKLQCTKHKAKSKRKNQEQVQQQLQQLQQQLEEYKQQQPKVDLFLLYEEAVQRKGLPNADQHSSVWDTLAETGVAGLAPKAITGDVLRQVSTTCL
jgi:type II secretory pathway pseudopilin PulG